MTHDQHNLNYYLKCMTGGALACGITHVLTVPLDVAKCKKQIDPNFCSTMIEGIKKVKAARQFTLGWFPTVIGYSLQGTGKFGYYEIFKDVYRKIVGEENAQKYRKLGWTLASASAQFFADLFLCPFEAVKLKVQLARPGFQYPQSMMPAFRKLHAEEGFKGMYKGIIPLWSRQIPYTMVKFVAYQWFIQFFYENIFSEGKQHYSKPAQLGITFVSGFLAGILCAIASHPPDTIVSKLYSQGKSQDSTTKKIMNIYSQIGFRGLWAGLSTRMLMIGTIAGSQWWIYDTFKTIIGLQTSGGGKH